MSGPRRRKNYTPVYRREAAHLVIDTATWQSPPRWAHGRLTGLVLLETLAGPPAGNYRLDAVRAHLLDMTRDTDRAMSHYRVVESEHELPEHRYRTTKAARLRAPGSATLAKASK